MKIEKETIKERRKKKASNTASTNPVSDIENPKSEIRDPK